jgi:hypothetical protein
MADGEPGCVNLVHAACYAWPDDPDATDLFIFLTEWLGADDLAGLG